MNKSYLIIVILLFGLIIGAVGGFFVGRSYTLQNLPKPQEPQIKFPIPTTTFPLTPTSSEELPMPRELLFNPVIYEWRADVDGILVEKGKDYFVLEKNGKRLKISLKNVVEDIFWDKREDINKPAKPISYKDIPIGSRLIGVTYFNLKNKELWGMLFHLLPQER